MVDDGWEIKKKNADNRISNFVLLNGFWNIYLFLIIYDRFKTSKTLTEVDSTTVEKKFVLPEESSSYGYIDDRIDMRMIERDDALMDYSANIDMLDLRNKLYDAVIKESASIKTEDFNITADYTNTDQAYTKLINGEVDLIVVTEPSKEELERAKDAGVELDVVPVVNEGFVFYTHKDHAIDNLTLQEI